MEDKPSSFVVSFNVSKKHNVGTIARCCTAFDVKALCLVGAREYNTFGSHGSDIHVDMLHFSTLDECCSRLRTEHSCRIIGAASACIEIVDGAEPIQSHPFVGNTAFLLGNEGQGLSSRQKAACDKFVYIPQYGAGTASLNVAVACSIVLHHFAVWAQYEEQTRQGEKFVVAERQHTVRGCARGVVPPTAAEREDMQRRRRMGHTEVDDEAAEDVAQQFSELLS